jgi:hypothetical protein
MEGCKRAERDTRFCLVNSMSPFFVTGRYYSPSQFFLRAVKISGRSGLMIKSSSIIILIILSLSFSMLTCSDSEKRLSPLLNQTKVILDLGLPPAHAANDSAIWDTIRRFFIRDAVAQSAPAAFGSIDVRVSGPDIGVMEQSFGPLGTLSLNVPSGSFRQFEVIAHVAPGSPSAAASFSGAAIANLPAGETVSVMVYMTLNETKIVIPEGGTSMMPDNSGLIMMDDMSGTNWTYKVLGDYTGISSGVLMPYDISYDSRGRIYIANNSTIGVIRMDDINGTNILPGAPTIFGTGTAAVSNVRSISVDRINNLVYFVNSGSQLYRSNLDGTSTVIRTGYAAITTITGIDVDSAGMLYIVGATNRIIRYNPNTQTTIAGPYTTSLSSPQDVIVKAPYIYITNNGSATAQILQLAINNNVFSSVGQFGTVTNVVDTPNFYGAHHFLAIRNDLIIADIGTDAFFMSLARLVSISPNPLGLGWVGWGHRGTPSNVTPGVFMLYNMC